MEGLPGRDLVRLDLSHPSFMPLRHGYSIWPHPTDPGPWVLRTPDPKGNLQMIVDYNNDLEVWEWLDRSEMPMQIRRSR
jgi:hypothetical protein